MLGTVVNTICIVCGSCLGLFIKGGLKEKYSSIVMHVLGLSVLFIGASSSIGGMISGEAEPILYIISLVLGSLAGEFFAIENKLDKLGLAIQSRIGTRGGNVAQGFVTASLTYCVGTMAIIGSLESGIQGVHTTLFTKSVLDGISAIIFASTLGIGVLFSAICVFLYQGTLTMMATVIQPFLTNDMIREISIVGGILIFALGLNMLGIKKFKVGNMVLAILVPVIYYLPVVQKVLGFLASVF